MEYITAIDAVEGLDAVGQTDGIMLTGEDCLMRIQNQRLLMQSLLLDPPEREDDERLEHLLRCQKMLWLEKIEECVQVRLCVRMPDRPVDAFLPGTPAEFTRLSQYTSRPVEWLRAQTRSMRNLNPDLSCRGCRMMISNEWLLQAFLNGLFTAARQSKIHKMSILLPFVSECQEVGYLKSAITECAARYEIDCTVGVEIATPRAACVAGELAAYTDVIIFNVDELVQLLYGMSHRDTKKVINRYLHEHVFRHNPFQEFDSIGIGTLLDMALEQIRAVRPGMRLGAIGDPVLTEKGRAFCTDRQIDMLIGPQHLFHSERVFGVVEGEDGQAADAGEPAAL